MKIRTRFAPSPTGYVHVGSLRTALYCYLYSKQQKGSYILRIEDTDRSRYVEGSIENLIREMNWAGIINDEGAYIENDKVNQRGDYGPYIQSERLEIYDKYVDQLLESGHAYKCFCTKKRLEELKESGSHGYDGKCRGLSEDEIEKNMEENKPYVVRLKMPKDQDVVIDDLIRGKVTMNTSDSDDQVLRKSDGFPTYHMAVVVDDHLMEISHIIRGEEWLSSTPKHIILYEALGWDAPKFAHLPNILGSNRKKLSKRTGDVSVSVFRDKGYLPEALVNFLALIGWNPGTEEEIMPMDKLIESFSFENVQKSPGLFDIDKLNHINNHYIRIADNERLYKLISDKINFYDKDKIIGIIDLVKEKVNTVNELVNFIPSFFTEEIEIEEDAKEIIFNEKSFEVIKLLREKLIALDEFEPSLIKGKIKEIQKELGVKGKDLFMPVRIGVTGSTKGSDLARTISLMGKELVVKILDKTIEEIHENL